MMMKLKKRAISPLIATVLLVAFSVALGAIVMNFAEESAVDLTEQTDNALDTGIKCSLDLSTRILESNDRKIICYNRTSSDNLEFVLENQGKAKAIGVRVLAVDFLDNLKTEDVLNELEGHSSTKYNMSIAAADDGSSFIFPPTKVVITPLIQSDKGNVACVDSRIEVEDIEEC